jgi:hypothetical protein
LRATARPAHHLAEHRRQARPSARSAPIQAHGPIWPVDLARGADQHLPSISHRPHPRRSALVGVEGWVAAEGATRPALRLEWPIRRPHGTQGYAHARPRARTDRGPAFWGLNGPRDRSS